ncbi:MAG: tRNA (guanine-N7)-methyltransferase [Chlorobium sp.]|jgi:tRNA (guanine-N7-)-methyltransferase|uniref:tRNA (guanine(46)-N(7))-methyltransferase TrmB n=1 Tax=Chlorobium sp. TaxID=1095 RepID=UPI001D3628C7|nr:tRNA (guanine-N7)-methyltransferase [Chlorobium sp.]MBN1279771.1 tRNA (guanine-N7)-methyltransferase [Chlorobiaceae bacterium]MCF8217337.1 tRNA (guanine-N7)-methyltransferase [Chlorobium sp.]MCF8272181.1 tRNA (guanine-N7)-methyltransferase [Chlorobium sp.]MCF8288550.1 tRNA (guanine-N7)-methyltransferase [Chlorobium sp.]MCF8292150.1 tRNA (guanine-N7)-methyltransferase [Chlorobium sp.]
MDTRKSLCKNTVISADRETWTEEHLKDAETIEVEIGFGSGEYLIRRASEHPDRLFIGIEKKPGMVTEVSKRVASRNLDNIRLIESCAKTAFADLFPACSVSRIYSLFPDPWPKRKHSKYRLFSTEYLCLVNNRLKVGGETLIVTDSADYYHWILRQTPDAGFEIEHGPITPQFNTRFERIWLEQDFNTFFRILLKKTQQIKT